MSIDIHGDRDGGMPESFADDLRIGASAEHQTGMSVAKATGIVLDILRRLDVIGGLIPEKPRIQLQQQNVMVGGVTFADLVREARGSAGE